MWILASQRTSYTHKWDTFESRFSILAQKVSNKVFSFHLRDYTTAPSSGRLCVQPVYKLLFMQPYAPWDENQIINKSFLMAPLTDKPPSLYCESSHTVEDFRIGLHQREGVPWQQISQSTLNAGNRCNKYRALIDVSYVLRWQWFLYRILVIYFF